MTPQLTPEMRQALSDHPDRPLPVVDPTTNRSYFLVPAARYRELESLRSGGESHAEADAEVADGHVSAEVKAKKLDELVAATKELFGGDASVYESHDPEYPDEQYTVIAVTTRLDPTEAVRTEREWMRRAQSIGRCLDEVRLSIRFAQ